MPIFAARRHVTDLDRVFLNAALPRRRGSTRPTGCADAPRRGLLFTHRIEVPARIATCRTTCHLATITVPPATTEGKDRRRTNDHRHPAPLSTAQMTDRCNHLLPAVRPSATCRHERAGAHLVVAGGGRRGGSTRRRRWSGGEQQPEWRRLLSACRHAEHVTCHATAAWRRSLLAAASRLARTGVPGERAVLAISRFIGSRAFRCRASVAGAPSGLGMVKS